MINLFKKNKNEKKYEAVSVTLETMKDEYTKERERGGILDTKAVSLITILLALVTVYMPIIPFEKIVTVYMAGEINKIIWLVIILVIFAVALIITFTAFVILMNVIKIKTYMGVDVDEILEEDAISIEKHRYELSLCFHYKRLISHNENNNNLKSQHLNKCYVLTIVSFILLLISCIGMKIL